MAQLDAQDAEWVTSQGTAAAAEIPPGFELLNDDRIFTRLIPAPEEAPDTLVLREQGMERRDGKLRAFTDIHGVVDVDLDILTGLYLDNGDPQSYNPGLLEYHVLEEAPLPESPDTLFRRFEQLVGFRFLLFRNSYRMVLNYWIHREDDSLRIWWNLQSSDNDDLEAVFGSFLAQEREDGLYVRHYVVTDFARVIPGLEWALQLFGGDQALKAAWVNIREADRRQNNGDYISQVPAPE